MRRAIGFVLLGVGVFALTLGMLLRFYAYPRLAKAPLDPNSTSVAEGSDITALVIPTVNGTAAPEIRDGLDLVASRHVSGDLTQPEVVEGGDVAVWVEATRVVVDDGSELVVSASVRSLCLDRHTNEAVAPCEGQYIEEERGSRVDGDRNVVQQPGHSLKFPFDTGQRSYQFYDLRSKRSVEARFDGEEQINGLDVYRFVQEVPLTDIGDEEVPGSLIGQEDQSLVAVDLYYQTTRTMWVEPATGQIVKGSEQIRQELVLPGQTPGTGTVVFDGRLTFNDDTVNKFVSEAKENRSKLNLLTFWPVVMWIAGGVIVVVGLVLLFAGRRPVGSHSGTRHRQPVGAGRR